MRRIGEDPFHVEELGRGVELVDETCCALRVRTWVSSEQNLGFLAAKGLAEEAGANRSSP